MANEQKNKSIGEVKIAADVVAAIAGLAATEVDGVYAMAGTLTNELAGMLGVKVQMELGVVHVDMMISVRYGYSIPKVTEQVQERVSQQIETMTGLTVSEVNVRVSGVNLGNE